MAVKIYVMALVVLALPSICGSGEYSRKTTLDAIVENRGGEHWVKQRSNLSQRIELFAVKYGADELRAADMAELLCSLQNGKVLAAIAAKESGFDIQALGLVGEVGAYQVRPEFWGDPGGCFKSQTEKADKILQELLDASKGDLATALERYNGSGLKAKAYASSVLSLIAKI